MVLPDKYPKARAHGLVLVHCPSPPAGPSDLVPGPASAALVRGMAAAGRAWAEGTGVPGPWRLGFHSSPSLEPLHMHVVSGDLVSDWMKTKKHWNSFAGAFFADANAVASYLDTGRRPVALLPPAAADAALKAPLACHRCGAEARTMPALKTHIAACRAPVPFGEGSRDGAAGRA